MRKNHMVALALMATFLIASGLMIALIFVTNLTPMKTMPYRVAFLTTDRENVKTFAHTVDDLEANIEVYDICQPEDGDIDGKMQHFVIEGGDLVIADSEDFLPQTLKMQRGTRNVISYVQDVKNPSGDMRGYYIKEYEAEYIAGVMVGQESKTGVIAYIDYAAQKNICYNVNAFTLGVRYSNPNAKVLLYRGSGAADIVLQSLTANRADIIMLHRGGNDFVQEAERIGMATIVWSDGDEALPEHVLLALSRLDDVAYSRILRDYMNSRLKTSYYMGMSEGAVRINKMARDITPDSRRSMEAIQHYIQDGGYIFKGPIYDNQGMERVRYDAFLTNEEILSQDWLVQGVILL